MMNYSSEFLSLLKNPYIRESLSSKNFKDIYKNIEPHDLVPQFTDFCQNVLNVDPLEYMDYIPPHYLRGCAIDQCIIPDGITSIGDEAFRDCQSLTSVVIPSSVTSIGENVFWDCPIQTATISTAEIEYIPKYKLITVILTGGTSIFSYAFYNCTTLTSIEIAKSVKDIGSWAFYNCTSLTNIVIPDGVTSIGSNAFRHCGFLTSVVIPDSVKSIGDHAFSDCPRLTEINYNGTKKEALQLGIGSKARKKWREYSPIQKIICTDGVIGL